MEQLRRALRLVRVVPARVRRAWAPAGLVREPMRFLVREALGRTRECAYRLRGTEATVLLRHGSLERVVLAEVLSDGFYVPPQPVRQLVAASAARPLVVDLGAHLGYFGLRALVHWPRARIVGWEPDPDQARLLRRCIAANSRQDDWSVVEACAATRDGQVSFRAGLGPASHVPEDPADGTMQAPARDVFPSLRDAALVKMDIEGSEWALLADERFEEVCPPAMFLEWHGFRNAPADPRTAVTERLEGLGYALLHQPGDARETGLLWAWRA